ncbi:RagB/SusD family nutrient uptake outer membrane protein [Marinilabilia salmonicolor]|uniref:RagB/SusD family nutrient uptake outer membrane protein n=1 Tax=Marinilabilia salmonicolor TaxID=989 RepID=UPI00029AF0D1|nr:RagB/SusD family nutrient uptake outer membrane protein [Marinilabilia salmonicolor]
MKSFKIYLIAALGVVGLGLSSCSDSFLDVEPETSLFDENFYSTQADAELALIGCYDGWQRTSSDADVSFYLLSEVMSDQCFGATGVGDDRNYQAIDRFDLSEAPSYSDLGNNLWESYYRGIFRCNKLLQELDNVAWNGDTEETQLSNRVRVEGETRVLRAILYFDMIRLFGNIPLLTEPSEENLPQVHPDEVYKLIAEDLMFGAENIPADAYPKSNANENDGRISQYAAKALLARVYLYYTGYYEKSDLVGMVSAQEALSGLEDIIASEEYGLVGEFRNLWPAASMTLEEDGDNKIMKSSYAGRGNQEVVLAKKFNYTQDYNGNMDGNRWLVMLGMRNFSSFPYGRGWGACTVHPEFPQAFGDGDTRRAASMIDLVGEGIEGDFETLDDQREYTGFSVKKYTPMSKWEKDEASGEWTLVDEVAGLGEGDFQISQYQDWVIVRYADVLLMAAELGSANATEYLNRVRRRAYTVDGEVGAGFNEVSATPENILEERALEFAFEGIRYWDLLRQGIDKAASQIAEENGVDVLTGGSEDQVVIQASNFVEKKGLFQIPQTQITLSNYLLEQNAGW